MTIPTYCRYCGGKVILCDSSVIYGRSYGNIYLCTHCRAYVGADRKTGKPLGTLADAPLRAKRKEARAVIEAWARAEEISTAIVYKWLAGIPGIPDAGMNISRFEPEQCDKVIKICREALMEAAS